MQAIETKYLGPTNTRGARIKAWCEAGSVTIPFSYSGPTQVEPHREAVETLVRKLGWAGRWVLGGTYRGFVAVCVKTYGFTPGRKDRRYSVVFS